jgi:hypothetical protein
VISLALIDTNWQSIAFFDSSRSRFFDKVLTAGVTTRHLPSREW